MVADPPEPFDHGHLDVGDGHRIYWEASGNPLGSPVLYLHGGPGSGLRSGYRRRVDPTTHRIIGFDQRGCGRSTPNAGLHPASLATNTTAHLIADIERLRDAVGVEQWLVHGVSWGTSLGLAYAVAHPERVTGLVLMAVTTTTRREVEWITHEMRNVYPEEWETMAGAITVGEGERLIEAYARVLSRGPVAERQRAADAWRRWEDVHMGHGPTSTPSADPADAAARLTFSTLVTWYWSHDGFGTGSVWEHPSRLDEVPVVLIHGRRDVSSPLATAWDLHRRLARSELVVVEDEGHGGEAMVSESVRAIARLTS